MSSERAGNDRYLAVIPARGGSKRLPRKNVMPLLGKPLIGWTIEAALGCARLGEVMVSTDSPEIHEVSLAAGAAVPFLRPATLATDTASSMDVIRHAVEFYRTERKRAFEYLVLLQPTSPLRGSADIDAALDLLESKGADAVVSVCEMDHSPLWSNVLPENLSLEGFIREEVKNRRSQDLPKHYRINGALYVCRVERMLAENTLFLASNIFAHVMPKAKSVDIDDAVDFRIAEVLGSAA
jgi:CMP-N-acetylneuraminic acid synthetase